MFFLDFFRRKKRDCASLDDNSVSLNDNGKMINDNNDVLEGKGVTSSGIS